MEYKNENATIQRENSNQVIVFLPRFSQGGTITIITTIEGSPIRDPDDTIGLKDYIALNDYNYKPTADSPYFYRSHQPFSVTAIYDGGFNKYHPPENFTQTNTYFYTGKIITSVLFAILGSLIFTITYRHKRISLVKFAFNILDDIIIVLREFRNEGTIKIVSTKNWNLKHKDNLRFFSRYKDYFLINNFYKSLKKRHYIMLKDEQNIDKASETLKEENENCFTTAKNAYFDIKWSKFYKIDLMYLVPSIAFGSFFITFISEGIPFYLYWGIDDRYGLFLTFTITAFITRSISGILITTTILYFTHGIRIILNPFFLLLISLPLSIFIIGLPEMTILLHIENYRLNYVHDQYFHDQYSLFYNTLFGSIFDFIFKSNDYRLYLTAISLTLDIIRMFILTLIIWIISRWLWKKIKLKIKT